MSLRDESSPGVHTVTPDNASTRVTIAVLEVRDRPPVTRPVGRLNDVVLVDP